MISTRKRGLSTQRIIAVCDDIDQAAREIYYALSYMKEGHPAFHNLMAALEALGVEKPGDVGLSDYVLKKQKGAK